MIGTSRIGTPRIGTSRPHPLHLAPLLGLVCGCAGVAPKQARSDASALIEERSGVEAVLAETEDAEARRAVDERLDELLDGPLTEDDALRIALLNNPHFLADVQSLGVAQADLVQAGLLQNPSLGGDLVISTRGFGPGGGLGLSQSLLSAFLIPAQRRLAKRELQRAILELSHDALELIRDVRTAYADVAAARRILDLERDVAHAARLSDELAASQLEAGNIAPLRRQEIGAELDASLAELSRAQLSHVQARESLTRLLGLWGQDIEWELPETQPPIPSEPLDLQDAERAGIEQRLDLSAARFEVDALRAALRLSRWGVLPGLDVGAEARNEVGDDEGHEWVIGPSLSVQIPLFDPGHADRARLRAMVRQAELELQGQSVDARSDIREHVAEVVTARREVDYLRDTAVPRAESISQLTLEQYNGMLVGAYEVFGSKRDEARTRQSLAQAERDYWAARSALELAVGGRLPE